MGVMTVGWGKGARSGKLDLEKNLWQCELEIFFCICCEDAVLVRNRGSVLFSAYPWYVSQ